jgi:MFS family permease
LLSSRLASALLRFGLMGPFAAAFINRYGVRKVALTALGLICAGLGLSLLMSRLWELPALGRAGWAGDRAHGPDSGCHDSGALVQYA